MLFTHLLANWFLSVAMIVIATGMGFGKCTGHRLLWVILQNFEMLWPKGLSVYYDKEMPVCEEKNLG